MSFQIEGKFILGHRTAPWEERNPSYDQAAVKRPVFLKEMSILREDVFKDTLQNKASNDIEALIIVIMCLRLFCLELFRTKCKLLEYSLTAWLPVHLLISSSACFGSVITSPSFFPHGLLAFIPSMVDLYYSCISASHNLSCFLLLPLSRFTIVFQFGMAPLMSRCSKLLRWSPK